MRFLMVACLVAVCACGFDSDSNSPSQESSDPPVSPAPTKYRFECTNTYTCSNSVGGFSVTGSPFPYCDVANAPNALATEKKWCEDNQKCHCQTCSYGESCTAQCTATGATCN